MKKILFISHMYPTKCDESYGKVIHDQALSLINKGYQIKVISPIPYTPYILKNRNKRFFNYYNTPPVEIHDNIEVYYPRYLSLRRSPSIFYYSANTMYKSILKQIGEIRKSFDFNLIHAHFAFPDAYAAMKISEYFNVKLVTTLQATDLDFTFKKSNKLKSSLDKVFKYSDTVITPTPRLRDQLINLLNIDSEIVGYGVDLEKVYKGNFQHTSNTIKVVSVSRLINTKGIDDNLKALKILRERNLDIRYVIVGDGPDRDRIVKLISKLELNEYTELKGALSHNEALEYIATADIFSLPSWQETFGLVYLEAMLNEKPVIGCKGQGFDGIIRNYFNGFLAEPLNPESIVNIIEYIIGHPTEVKKIGINARKTVEKDFAFDKIANKIDAIYKKLLQNKDKRESEV